MPIVALVGRPNVGKSALFNRITESRRAIVEDFEGVTRDRLYQETDWNGRTFTMVDTGGIWEDTQESLLTMTREQTEQAIQEADVLVFVVDGQAGVTAADQDVADRLRRSRKPVILAVNKAEGKPLLGEFYQLGFGEPLLVSAVHGQGIGDLLDRIVDNLPDSPPTEASPETAPVRIAIAGRPNVGKSSLLNWISGTERTLVTPIAGTTRDVVDSLVEHDGRSYLFLDTAGLRRPSRIDEALEQKTVQRSLAAIREADVVLLMLNAAEGLLGQDQRIAGQIATHHKAAVVLLNKADLVKGSTVPLQTRVKEQLPFLSYATVLPISVLTGWHLEDLWPAIEAAYDGYCTRVTTHALNRLIDEAIHLSPPPTKKGRQLKIYYATQVGTRPPHFVLFVNDPELVHFSYERYIEHRLREAFGFTSSPIRLTWRARRRGEGQEA
ncbi:ribosome-associated GTPase EngA [Sulfobacillus acidophilus TPY]|uniref:GTPase Der n=1 Tax=Sulfobacillus acidophilus (strain ATCC 700253 / DSM 10332 / NAL) TaxID=679936 RepID=G8U1E4_SULAD|nr:ribosome-associated GTPase EngA [Sulfobacillus acidophilus TPY]AEW05464.1 GTP-binding protein engA [Sulfobacillus acidophilus DSM 10332]